MNAIHSVNTTPNPELRRKRFPKKVSATKLVTNVMAKANEYTKTGTEKSDATKSAIPIPCVLDTETKWMNRNKRMFNPRMKRKLPMKTAITL